MCFSLSKDKTYAVLSHDEPQELPIFGWKVLKWETCTKDYTWLWLQLFLDVLVSFLQIVDFWEMAFLLNLSTVIFISKNVEQIRFKMTMHCFIKWVISLSSCQSERLKSRRGEVVGWPLLPLPTWRATKVFIRSVLRAKYLAFLFQTMNITLIMMRLRVHILRLSIFSCGYQCRCVGYVLRDQRG